ncbi:MAG: hypothetical protein AMXMBFR58_29790 [Phycisphaerae bacterium]
MKPGEESEKSGASSAQSPPAGDKSESQKNDKPVSNRDAAAPAAQKPTVGRIVDFYPKHTSASAGKGQPYPAVITHAWSDTTVNLHILDDGSFPVYPLTPTSVVQRPHGAAPEANAAGWWDWPKRT